MSGLLCFYGDDFTGSTDVALRYRHFGLRTVLVTEVPPVERARELAADGDVLGIAGLTRSLPAAEIAPVLAPAFDTLAALAPRLVQYKVCSTADSSPLVGSFGPALQLGRARFGERPVAVVVAQPELGRYTLFSHHFAADGGEVHRLDRQPAMANHPVTPMRESDLRRHIAEQTPLTVAGLDVLALSGPDRGARRWAELSARGAGAVVVDALDETHLRAAADLLLGSAPGATAFALGSGGLSTGVALALTGGEPGAQEEPVAPLERALVVSGSRSALTARQIEHALARGWHGVALDLAALAAGGARRDAEVERAARAAERALASGPGVVVHSSPGAPSEGPMPPVAELGAALGSVVRACRERAGIERVVVAGGDTSGYVTRALGVEALAAVGAVQGQALLCQVSAGDPAVAGLELVLKGGQIGGEDLFEAARTGR